MSTPTSVFQTNFRRLTDGETVTDIAARIGVDHSTVSRYLQGKREPRIGQLRLIAQAYEVSADSLLGLDEATEAAA